MTGQKGFTLSLVEATNSTRENKPLGSIVKGLSLELSNGDSKGFAASIASANRRGVSHYMVRDRKSSG